MDETTMDTSGRLADRAMGLELEAVDLEVELEWAEAQGRLADAADISEQMAATFDALADLVDADAPGRPVQVHVNAAHASDAT